MSLKRDNLELHTLARAQAEAAFAAHGSFLINVLKKDLPEQDAWDVFQELYLNIAIRGIPEGIDNVRAYLYRAAQNDIIDFKRKSATQRKIIQQSLQAENPKLSENPAKKLMQFDLIMKSFEKIAKVLNPSINQVFVQKYQYNLSHHEIAEKLKIKKETVDRYMSIGTKQIQELYHQFMGDSDEQT